MLYLLSDSLNKADPASLGRKDSLFFSARNNVVYVRWGFIFLLVLGKGCVICLCMHGSRKFSRGRGEGHLQTRGGPKDLPLQNPILENRGGTEAPIPPPLWIRPCCGTSRTLHIIICFIYIFVEKVDLRGFRPGPTQTGLISQRR